MDYNNIDNILTDRVRNKIDEMKKEKSVGTIDAAYAFGSLMGTITLAILKLAALAGLIWLGWHCCVLAFQFPTVSFWQTAGILAGIRSLSMFLVDPYIKKPEEKK
jgi:hypothetical protein